MTIEIEYTDKEIKTAQKIYREKAKPIIDRLNEISLNALPKILKTETEVKVYYEQMPEVVELNKTLSLILEDIRINLKKGMYR